MNDPMERIERLARRAQSDAAPPVDVRAAVFEELHAGPAFSPGPVLVFAAASSVAAGFMAISAATLIDQLADPILGWMRVSWFIL